MAELIYELQKPGDKQKQCSNCGAFFGCTNTEADGRCWCENYPPVFQPDATSDCLCPACLKAAIAKKIEEFNVKL